MKTEEVEKVNKEVLELYDFVESITTIECDKCHIIVKYGGDAFDCIDAIHEEGWRIINEKCLCKSCVSKK